MTEHELKTWPPYWGDVYLSIKTFEYRRNDRNFQVGDIVILREWDPRREVYTGAKVRMQIGYLIYGGQFGIPDGYCIFSLCPVKNGE